MPPDKPGFGPGSDLVGRRYRTQRKPREQLSWRPSHSFTGEGSTGGGNLDDHRSRLPRGNGGSTQGRVVPKLAKPSWSRGERPRSKVGAGNSTEDQRVAAGLISSSEPLVMRWDPAESRGPRREREPGESAKEIPAGRYFAAKT